MSIFELIGIRFWRQAKWHFGPLQHVGLIIIIIFFFFFLTTRAALATLYLNKANKGNCPEGVYVLLG